MIHHLSKRFLPLLFLLLLPWGAAAVEEERPYAHQGTLQQLQRDGRTLVVAMAGLTGEAQYQTFWLSVTPPVVIHGLNGSRGGTHLLQPNFRIGFNTGLFAKPGIPLVTEIWLLAPPALKQQ